MSLSFLTLNMQGALQWRKARIIVEGHKKLKGVNYPDTFESLCAYEEDSSINVLKDGVVQCSCGSMLMMSCLLLTHRTSLISDTESLVYFEWKSCFSQTWLPHQTLLISLILVAQGTQSVIYFVKNYLLCFSLNPYVSYWASLKHLIACMHSTQHYKLQVELENSPEPLKVYDDASGMGGRLISLSAASSEIILVILCDKQAVMKISTKMAGLLKLKNINLEFWYIYVKDQLAAIFTNSEVSVLDEGLLWVNHLVGKVSGLHVYAFLICWPFFSMFQDFFVTVFLSGFVYFLFLSDFSFICGGKRCGAKRFWVPFWKGSPENE
ncbi:hypothetical protein VP01_2997g1 [Puccinia sorghi]|uniref:Uncharacterized protein n=1 Tax=Puccinia sorghi TaxID=27349 RepID=A0A0L6V0D9_9BASI|nr:hypothetical protein VP01_2997g1 [Puccinia sorghi]